MPSSIHDRDLLGAFVHSRSNDAFRKLVDRYLGFVLGTALRQTRNQSLAEEIAQNVLAILARKADSIRTEALSSWLHRTTLQQSLAAMRSEFRHRRKVAAFCADPANEATTSEAACFDDDVLRSLDDSLARLREVDKRILLLRFFEGQSFPEIAKRLGQSEAAVQRRGHRALERLGLLLRRRGVVVSAAGVAAALSSLPAETSSILATRVMTQALATAPQLSGATLLARAFYTMSIAKKLASGVAVVGTLVAAPVAIKIGANTPTVAQGPAAQDSPTSRSRPVPPAKPPTGGDNQAAKEAMRLGGGKQRYSLYEATRIAQDLVERLDINRSEVIPGTVHSLARFLQEGVLDSGDWEKIERIGGAKRRVQDRAGSRLDLMNKAAAVFLDKPGRDRGGPLSFVAYHLQRPEMLPTHGTPAELEAYDWVRAKACADRGVFEGNSPDEVTQLERLARKHPGELAWNSALIRAYLAQGDGIQALTLAEEAVAAQKLTDPGKSFTAAERTFYEESEAGGGGGWMAYFAASPNLSATYLPIFAADELFKSGTSLHATDKQMAARYWRSSIGMVQLVQTDGDVAARSEALGREKYFVKKLPDGAIQSIYSLRSPEVKSEIEAEFASLMSLSKILQSVLDSGDRAKIQEFKTAAEAEGDFAVLDRMRRAQQE